MVVMRVLADSERTAERIDRLAEAVRADVARSGDTPWAMIGIRRRGDVLARRLAERMEADRFADRVGSLDITLYRDDLSEIGPQPRVRTTEAPFSIDGMNILLVDDVLMSGRSIRAGLGSLMDLGRPRRVWLSVLVDRGGRELPIRPDHVGLDLTASAPEGVRIADHEQVEVMLTPTDEQDAIHVIARGD